MLEKLKGGVTGWKPSALVEMDPRCFNHWPWNQKTDLECPQDVAHSEVYHEFFINEKEITVRIPKCLEGFVWTGFRFVTNEKDQITWYPLSIILPLGADVEPLVHTIFIEYGRWNILPIAFTPNFITVHGEPILKLHLSSQLSGKIELLAQKLE